MCTDANRISIPLQEFERLHREILSLTTKLNLKDKEIIELKGVCRAWAEDAKRNPRTVWI